MKGQQTGRKTSPSGTHGVQVRMPVELHARLREIAERDRRPVNAQIVYLIERHVEAELEKAA